MATSSFRRPVSVKRPAPGRWIDGRWISGSETPMTISATVQPVGGRDLNILPSGLKHEHTFKVITETELYAGEDEIESAQKREPDRVILADGEYRVVKVVPHQGGVLNHYSCFVTRAHGLRTAS